MSGLEQNTHREYWITTTNPAVVDCVLRIHVPGKILVAEQKKHGTIVTFHIEHIGAPDDDYDILTTLDAFMAMGARIHWTMPKQKAPPEDN